MSSVMVLNASYEPHQVVSLPHAIKMLVREVAVVEEAHADETIGPFPVPLVLRLVKYVYVKVKGGPRYSRVAVFKRDNYVCAYCGGHATTLDHVVPRSQGGKSTWLNSVSACRKCNEKKAARTPAQANMRLRYEPFVPSYFDLNK